MCVCVQIRLYHCNLEDECLYFSLILYGYSVFFHAVCFAVAGRRDSSRVIVFFLCPFLATFGICCYMIILNSALSELLDGFHILTLLLFIDRG